MSLHYKTILPIVAAGVFLAGCAGSAPAPEPAVESKLMHCFAFTAIAAATEADWQAFYTATDELPSKIPGLNGVSRGRLLTPIVGGAQRDYAVCMEMSDEVARTAYGEHPAHAEWVEAYGKVRVQGTTTFDYLME
jgi:butyrate kinase